MAALSKDLYTFNLSTLGGKTISYGHSRGVATTTTGTGIIWPHTVR